MNTTIHLVRHATHDAVGQILVGRMPGVRLSADGRQQAARLAAWFAGQAVDAVQSSPRERARETARPIAERSGRDCEVVVALEEVDVGEWTGRRFTDLRSDPRWTLWNVQRGRACAPGGESMRDVQRRIVDHLHDVHARLHGGRVVAVSHAEVIRAALLAALDLDLDAFHRIEVEPASVSTIAVGGHNLSLVGMNEKAGW